MRISDWSSDVCSSDLSPTARPPEGAPPWTILFANLRAVSVKMPRRCAATISPTAAAKAIKIGRASCRGKSVSVRVDLGGRRIIKKKKTEEEYHMLNTNESSHTHNNTEASTTES